MSLPVGWADVARRGDLAEVHGEIAYLRGEFKADLAALQTRLIVANVATACAVGGLVLAAVKLA